MLSRFKNKESGPARTFTRIFSKGGCFKGGFTLLEILLVIGIIAILAGIVIVAINPSKQLATVRNTQRKSDLKQIYNALTQYYIDNSAYPSTISTTTLNEVCNTGAVSNTSTSTSGANCATAGLANLSVLVPTYLTAIPTDPTGTSSLLSFIPTAYAATTATGTGYKVGVNTAKQVLISAPLAELGVRVVVGNVPAASTLGNGLVAHYLMNDNLGTTVVLDNKGSYNGTAARNTSVLTAAGKIGTGLTFNGSGDKILLNSNLGLGGQKNATVALWLNGIPIAGFKGIFNDTTDNAVEFMIGYDINNIYFSTDNGDGFIASGALNRSGWHHLVCTKSATQVRMYYDGVEIGNSPQSNTTDIVSENFILGLDRSIAGRYYQGVMDDVRIYDRALTPNEITQLYNGGEGTEAE
jgi:prepilin-type N-terminal cleavage/methylation domain-containing protein